MGTATRVKRSRDPHGEELAGDEALSALRDYGRWRLVRDAFVRFRYADGFSHARALAFQTVVALLPFLIAVVGLSAFLHTEGFGRVAELTLRRLTSGPSSGVVQQVLDRSRDRADDGGRLALWLGALFSLLNVATAMCQIERGANRIYGLERDRPFRAKYLRGLLMALTAGLPLGLGFVLMVAGQQIARSVSEVYGIDSGTVDVWALLRWPVGVLLTLISASVIFRRAPRRSQPGYTWLAFGAAVYLVLWTTLTWALSLYLRLSGSFDAVYGPLSAFVSLLVWAYLTAIALFLGLAFAAQLEAVRVGRGEPILPDPGA
ncbi:YihY/virulence factor BrkB family protein [Kitasatospora sp. NBC_00315]|uniref:YihY/virulence factor BrkB family protein n=1 Tax=Kitasatospora sp. NBC_00315 TaxID=2975963 RepID=UPI0032456D70